MSLTFQLSERCLPFLPLKPNNHETNPTCNSQKKWAESKVNEIVDLRALIKR